MKANTIENIIADQLFKLTKSDENISSYLIDCNSGFCSYQNTLND